MDIWPFPSGLYPSTKSWRFLSKFDGSFCFIHESLSASHALSWHLRQPEFSPLFKRDYSELLVTRSCIDCLAASPLHLHVARFKGCHSFPSKMMMTLISNCESAIPMISIAQSGCNDDLSCTYLYPTRLVSSPSFRHCCCCSSQCPCSLAGGALVQVTVDLICSSKEMTIFNGKCPICMTSYPVHWYPLLEEMVERKDVIMVLLVGTDPHLKCQ
jgi:hypothetical protein